MVRRMKTDEVDKRRDRETSCGFLQKSEGSWCKQEVKKSLSEVEGADDVPRSG
jgi:hypothetical protein